MIHSEVNYQARQLTKDAATADTDDGQAIAAVWFLYAVSMLFHGVDSASC